MTVPKFIFVFLGSLGEIGGPEIALENTCFFRSQLPLSPYYSVARAKAHVLSHMTTGFATKAIFQGAPLPTEHSKNYDSAWDWF